LALHKNEDFHHSYVYDVRFTYEKFQRQIWSLAYSKSFCNARRLNELAMHQSFFDDFLCIEEIFYLKYNGEKFETNIWNMRGKFQELLLHRL